tara:strand:- start:439 stop:1941 length:1503 start_codon:yes stop_codon:yes gene_type:complete
MIKKNLKYYLGYLFFIIIPIFLISPEIHHKNRELSLIDNIILVIFFSSILIIIYKYLKRIKKINYLPIYVLSLFYILTCYLLIFLSEKYKIFPYKIENYSYVIKLLFVSYLLYSIGYFFIKFLTKNFKRKEIKFLQASINEILILGLLCIISVIFFYYYIKIQNYFSFLAQVKFPIYLFGCGLLITYIVKEKKSKTIFIKFFSFFLIIIPLYLELISGAFSFPFTITFLFFVFYCFIKKKIVISPFIILFLLFMAFHIGKYDFRKNLEFSKNSETSNSSIFFNTYNKIFSNSLIFNKVVECENFTTDNFVHFYFYDKNEDCKYVKDYRLERRVFHSIESLLIVTTRSPHEVPHWNGYSYKILSTKLIPRIFWKDKPSDTLGNQFGRRYNVLTKKDEKNGYEDDFNTSWNMPIFNEFFVNFGLKGSIIGSFLFGLLIGFIERLFTIKNDHNLEKIFSFFLFTPLFLMENHLSLMFGAVIQSYIFLLVSCLFFLFLKRKIKN